jgi:tetratricopeptide (TPR) repeat protein
MHVTSHAANKTLQPTVHARGPQTTHAGTIPRWPGRSPPCVYLLSHTHTRSGYQAHARRLLGDVARRREPADIDQATAHYHQAQALAESLGMRPLVAHCHLGLGTLYAKTGRPEQARAELSAAIDLYRAMAMTFWLPQAEAALAQVEGR